MSEAIENVRLGLSELGIDVPPDVSDAGLKDYLDDILGQMRVRSASDARSGGGASESRFPSPNRKPSLSGDSPSYSKPRTKTLREMVPFPKKTLLMTSSLYSTSDTSSLYSAQDSDSDFPEPSPPRAIGAAPGTRSSLPASLSLGGGSTLNESDEDSDNESNRTDSGASDDDGRSDGGASDGGASVDGGVSDDGGVSPTRRVVVGAASSGVSRSRLQRGRLMNVVSALPVHPPTRDRASGRRSNTASGRASGRASVRTPRSARSHSTNTATTSSARKSARRSPHALSARPQSMSARRGRTSHSAAKARPTPQPRPYGLSTDRDRFRPANERSRQRHGIIRSRERRLRSCRYDTESDSESDRESDYGCGHDENAAGRDFGNRGGRPSNPLIDKIHRRRKTKAGIKSTDPVALYQYFQKQWKSDRFLANKKNGRRS